MTLIIDNGGHQIKAGLETHTDPVVILNCTAKVQKSMQYLISDQILQQYSHNGSYLHFIRPLDRGYLNNWQCEIDVWNYLLKSNQDFLNLNIKETSLLMTEPILNLYSLQCDTNEVVFEYFGFKEYLRRPAPWFSMYEFIHRSHPKPHLPHACNSNNDDGHHDNSDGNGYGYGNGLDSCTIVDTGFSFTHCVPFINQTCRKNAVSHYHYHHPHHHIIIIIIITIIITIPSHPHHHHHHTITSSSSS